MLSGNVGNHSQVRGSLRKRETGKRTESDE